MQYNRIIVIGFGKIAEECFKYIMLSYSDICSIGLIIFENHQLSSLPKIAANNGIIPLISKDKSVIKEFLLSISEKSLIVSANNNYIFSKCIVEKSNLTIVNFHNSLLPYHRGRNAPTWSIFEQDKMTGVTWHIVDAKIDNGDIVFQAKIPIGKNEIALGLIRKGQELGIKGFKEFFPRLIENTESLTKQLIADSNVIHYSTDAPNNGILDIEWGIEKISSFLRSMDFGPLPMFDKYINIEGERILIKGYSIIPLSSSEKRKSISINHEEIIVSENNLKIKVLI